MISPVRRRPHTMAVGLLLALAVSLAFLAITAVRSSGFFFEIALKSAQAGNAQLYFDRGGGYSESESARRTAAG